MTPQWALDLFKQVLEEAPDAPPSVRLEWRRSHPRKNVLRRIVTVSEKGWTPTGRYGVVNEPRPTWSSGRCFTGYDGSDGSSQPPRIVITAGSERTDAKLCLLHELAHALTPHENHGPAFWDRAWRLYRRYGVPIRYAKKRDDSPGSLAAYKRTKGGTV